VLPEAYSNLYSQSVDTEDKLTLEYTIIEQYLVYNERTIKTSLFYFLKRDADNCQTKKADVPLY